MTIFLVKYTTDPHHPAEWYIDSIYESFEDAQDRLKEMKTTFYYYECWIDEDYLSLAKH